MSNSELSDGLLAIYNLTLSLLPNWVIDFRVPIFISIMIIVLTLSISASEYTPAGNKTKKSSEESVEKKEDNISQKNDSGEEKEQLTLDAAVCGDTGFECPPSPEKKDKREVVDKILMLEELPQNIAHIRSIHLVDDKNISKVCQSEFSQFIPGICEYDVTLNVGDICTELLVSMRRLRKGTDLEPLRNIATSLKGIVDDWEEISKGPIITVFSFVESLVSLGKLCSEIRKFAAETDKIEQRMEEGTNLKYWRELADVTSSLKTLSSREVTVSLEFSGPESSAITAELTESLSTGALSSTSQYLYILNNIA